MRPDEEYQKLDVDAVADEMARVDVYIPVRKDGELVGLKLSSLWKVDDPDFQRAMSLLGVELVEIGGIKH